MTTVCIKHLLLHDTHSGKWSTKIIISMCYTCTLQLANIHSTLQYVCTVNKTKLKKTIFVSMLKRFPLNDQTLWIEPQTSKVKIPLAYCMT